jgi:imidazole glycerol-phosphate synthase subunit HisF
LPQHQKYDLFLGASPGIFEAAKDLRNHQTDAEKLLWTKLCKNQLGVKFRQQHPILSFVADFYCHSRRIIIEIDGPIHILTKNRRYDEMRAETLERYDITLLRFSNDQIKNNMEQVLLKIKQCVDGYPKPS